MNISSNIGNRTRDLPACNPKALAHHNILIYKTPFVFRDSVVHYQGVQFYQSLDRTVFVVSNIRNRVDIISSLLYVIHQ
jgi:hypothetical protein